MRAERGHFGWEYKKKHRDLDAAYNQLQLYREDLENPLLLIVCDLDRFEIHTNFTNTAKHVYRFDLLNLGDPGSLDLLKKAFTNPEALRPTQTTDEITKELADEFAALADSMQARLGIGKNASARRGSPDPADVATEGLRGRPRETETFGQSRGRRQETRAQQGSLFEEQQAHRIARFLMKLMFCMFAEDIELLQDKLFERILSSSRREPVQLSRRLKNLFEAMATGGEFGADVICHSTAACSPTPTSSSSPGTKSSCSSRSTARIGATSSPRSSAPCLNGSSTRPNARRSALTTRAGKTS